MEKIEKGRTKHISFPLLNLLSFSLLIFFLALDIFFKEKTLSIGKIH